MGRVGMSGHFLAPESLVGGAGNRIFVLGFNHFLTMAQSLGIPSLARPSPRLMVRDKCLRCRRKMDDKITRISAGTETDKFHNLTLSRNTYCKLESDNSMTK